MTMSRKNNKFVRHLDCYGVLLKRELKTIKLKRAFRNLLISLITIPAFTMYCLGNIAEAASKPSAPTVPVAVATVITQDVPVYINALGSVNPVNSVTVRTQINGQLLQVFFQEGQMVKANSKLAQIDPRPYEAQLMQYKGQLMRDKALLANAKIDLDRYKLLLSQDSISEQTLATQIALVDQYEGTVKTDLGLIKAVTLNLTYCDIISPIDGRVGLLQVDPGNYVQTSDVNGIAIINTVSPIYAVFSITEDDLPRLALKAASGEVVVVYALDRAQNQQLAVGQLYTIDNQIDPSTGTIKIKAIFANENGMLFPNQFVNIRLLIDTLTNAIVVPTTAIQYGVNGNYVYKVNIDQTVSTVPVTIKGSTDSTVAITGEINSGDIVVIEGADKLKQGTLIKILPTNKATGSNNIESI